MILCLFYELGGIRIPAVRYVIDASVALKWYIEEDYTEKAIEIRNRFVNGEVILYSPNILIFEVVNVLMKTGNYAEDHLIEVGNSLISFITQFENFSPTILKSGINMAYKSKTSLFETFYLALSEFYNCQLLTADTVFYNKVLIHYPDASIVHLKDI